MYRASPRWLVMANGNPMSNLAISNDFTNLTADGNTINTVFVRKKAIRIRKFITKTELSSYCDSSVCLLLNVFRCL